jgi:hypothetical protein
VATEKELNAWTAGEDVEGARRPRGRGGLSAGWWGAQAALTGFGLIYLAVVSSVAWLICLPVAVWMVYRARSAARQQRTSERLYGLEPDAGTTDAY